MKKLFKFFTLDFNSQFQILRSLLYIIFFYCLVNFLHFNVFKKIYKLLLRIPKITDPEITEAEKIVREIKMAASILPNHFVCLPQALVFKYRFRNKSQMFLRFGVKKEGNTLLSHAWVQYQNVYLIGDLPDFDFIPIWEL